MRLRALLVAFLAWPLAAQTSWILDSDAGSDDYLALAYLLAKPGVKIEAITSVNGLAGAVAGARMLSRVVAVSGRRDIPVYAGAAQPLSGQRAFPAEWRRLSEQLPGVTVPPFTGTLPAQSAVEYLAQRLKQPARILALGPLTNLALVLRREPALARNIRELVIMGGAVRVKGNLKDGGVFPTNNDTAEWNIFIDPQAAAEVFRQVPVKMVPLDATNQVPFRVEHVRAFEKSAKGTALGRFVIDVLHMDEAMIREGYYYAWDPLAAVVAAVPGLAPFAPVRVRVSQRAGEEGRTAEEPGSANAQMLARPDPAKFHAEFLGAFVSR